MCVWGNTLVIRRFQAGLPAENESGGQQAKNASVTNKRGLLRASSARRGAGENALEVHKSDFSGNETALETAHASAGESKGIIELHEVKESVLLKSATTTTAGERGTHGLLEESESDFSKNLAECAASPGRDRSAHATAGESDEIIGSSRLSELEFPSLNSSGCIAAVACARLPAVPGLSATASSSAFPPASLAVVAHARSTPMHVAHNSWSDTVRVQGPTGRRCTKGGVSGPAEDLRPCLRGGGRGKIFGRPAVYGGRLQVHFPGSNQAQVPGRSRVGVVTPSLHPEVPGIQFVSPGYGLDIRQSMGWTKVCGTTRSGNWVLKGNARTRMLPETLDHLRVGWSFGEHTRPPGLRQGTTVCVHTSMDGAAVRPQTNNAIWDGVGLWAGSHPSYHLGVVRRMCQRG